jgi:putative membrane protein
MMGLHYGAWWTWLVGVFFMLIFWGGIIALIIWAIRRVGGNSTSGTGQATPLEIAKARYARGEITKEQFEQLKKDLS